MSTKQIKIGMIVAELIGLTIGTVINIALIGHEVPGPFWMFYYTYQPIHVIVSVIFGLIPCIVMDIWAFRQLED